MALLSTPTRPRNTPSDSVWLVLGRRFFVCLCFWLCSQRAAAQELQAPEPKVKAAFLYNFTKLVDWPPQAFANANAPLIIGVLGKDPLSAELEQLVAPRVVQGRPLQIARFNAVEEIKQCHVLFISESERRKLNSIFDALRDKPILTVGDMKGFESRGMITLVKSNATIDLRINLEAARQAGLQLSSRLTRLDKNLRPLESGSGTNAPPK